MIVDAQQRADSPSSGRPRDDVREQAILDAAIELLSEVGYDCLNVDMIAGRARASKATIYRRWAGKAEVVTEAMRRRKCPAPGELDVPDTGSLREDLMAFFLGQMEDEATDIDVALIAGLLRAMRQDPELNDLMRSQVFEPKHAAIEQLIDRAVERGYLASSAGAAVATESAEALVFTRLVLDGKSLDPTFVAHVVDDVVLPLLR